MIQRVNQVAAEFRKISNRQMADTTKRTIRENVAINVQLTKMSDKTMELIEDNDGLKERERRQRQMIEILEANEKVLTTKNLANQKVSDNNCGPGGGGGSGDGGGGFHCVGCCGCDGDDDEDDEDDDKVDDDGYCW